jgi:ribosome-binding factor A
MNKNMASRRKDTLLTPSRGPSHRQLRVGEEVRHILSTLFLRSEFPAPGLPTSVTVTHVNMSPDLQNATVYIMPLGGHYREETLAYLKEIAGYIRHQLGKALQTKFTPSLRFRLGRTH